MGANKTNIYKMDKLSKITILKDLDPGTKKANGIKIKDPDLVIFKVDTKKQMN